MKKILFLLFCPVSLFAQQFSKEEIARWEKQAKQVTIIRDDYGVPHIYGKTDADAVFGLMYAQCEDDYRRVEMNYLEKTGGLTMLKGNNEIYNDLLIRILIDPDDAIKDFRSSPEWLKKLCNAWADAINFYLYKNPEASNVLKVYQPWFPFLWTDGSIGAINTAGIGANDLRSLYGDANPFSSVEEPVQEEVLTGSNGFAFSPKITSSGNAILYINPHVTFYFRPEVHMNSEEGLNVYGAVTWGQFFIYQGFNEHCGWMHTSSAVDAADVYIEKLSRKNGKWHYEYKGQLKPVAEKTIAIATLENGTITKRPFNILYTHHGPVMAQKNGQYLSMKADNRIKNGLIQCWQRTKAKNFVEFKKTLDLRGNISNNTVYADAEGNIAYWHGNRVPKRDTMYDWSKPVDGTIAATEWKGLHPVSEIVQSINPPNGWLQNCNSTPFTVAGTNSPKKNNYPAYMAPDGENFRGINAVRVLSEEKNYTIDKVIKAGYDTRLAAFEVLIPALLYQYEHTDITGSSYEVKGLSEAMDILKKWDFRCGENSIATTLAVHFGEKILPRINEVNFPANESADIVDKTKEFSKTMRGDSIHMLGVFGQTLRDLEKMYSKWHIQWGEINRFQRISPDIDNKFDDNQPGMPVGFASAQWGMLPSYVSRTFPGTQKRYGVNGNSFICAVEFGNKIKARSLLAGGQSGDPNSKHFFDQGTMYSKGAFKDVLFYREDVLQHVERKYHPGE